MNDALREALRKALAENGIAGSTNDGPHSWRCDYYLTIDPARGGGPCDCIDLLVDGLERAALAAPRSDALDAMAVDRLLALEHREDDEPCSCDECMSYGAEDAGADWYRIPPANRIAMRILDGADERFAALAKAFRDHDAALAADTPSSDAPERPA